MRQNSRGMTKLHEYVNDNDLDKVRELVNERRIDINMQDSVHNNTPLHSALKGINKDCQALAIIETFLRSIDLDVNITDANGRNALHLAVFYTNPITWKKRKLIERILNRKELELNTKDIYGKTAFHYTVYKSATKLDIAKCLLKKDALRVNELDKSGFSVLHYLAMKNIKKRVQMLQHILNLKQFDVNIKDKTRLQTPLHLAVIKTTSEMMIHSFLKCEQVNLNPEDVSGKTPLHYICEKHHTHGNLLKAFLTCGRYVDVNIRDKARRKIIHHISDIPNNMESLKVLLDYGENICLNDQDNEKRSALHYCALRGSSEMLDLLLDQAGIDLSLIDIYGCSVLHYCADRGVDIDVIKKVIARQKDIINIRDDKNQTAWDVAINKGDQKLQQLLSEMTNTELSSRNVCVGKSTLQHLLFEEEPFEMLKNALKNKSEIIKSPDSSGMTLLHYFMIFQLKECRYTCLKLLLDANLIDINHQDDCGKTALHYLTDKTFSCLQLLLQHNEVDVNRQDNYGCTPLHHFIADGHKRLVDCLLEHKSIDIDILDNKQRSPIHYAAKQPSGSEVLKRLVQKQAHLDLVDSKGRNVFHYCCISGHSEDVLEKLIKAIDSPNEFLKQQDKDGKPPFYYAYKKNHHEAVKILQTYKIGVPEEVTVSDLQYTDLVKLNGLKLMILGQSNWRRLCMELKKLSLVEFAGSAFDVIKNPACVNMGEAFINNIIAMNQGFQIRELYSISESNLRNDICYILEATKVKYLKDLEHDIRSELCICLCKDVAAGVTSWKVLANHCDLKEDTINEIEATSHSVIETCPLQVLFKFIKSSKPGLKLKKLVEVLTGLKLQAVANNLNGIIEEKTGLPNK